MTTYVTFGQDHRHVVGGVTFDKDCVAVLPSINAETGRALAFEIFGDKFCFECFNNPPDLQYFPRGLIPCRPEKRATWKCAVCDKENPSLSWTDTHGVAQCRQCGTPYRIYHYENGSRIDKAPETEAKDEWIPFLREYWGQHHRIIPSGFSFPGGQELATSADEKSFYEWVMDNHHRVPE